jgi:hypothetical protein
MTRSRRRSRAGTAAHLPLEGFEPVDVAFGGPGAAGQGEPGGDGGQVEADPSGEGVQFGLVVGFHALKPGSHIVFADAAGHHLREAGHMPSEPVEPGAVRRATSC